MALGQSSRQWLLVFAAVYWDARGSQLLEALGAGSTTTAAAVKKYNKTIITIIVMNILRP